MHIYILYIYLLLPYLLVCKLYLILIEKKKKVLKSSHIILEDIKLAAGFGGVHKYDVGGQFLCLKLHQKSVLRFYWGGGGEKMGS